MLCLISPSITSPENRGYYFYHSSANSRPHIFTRNQGYHAQHNQCVSLKENLRAVARVMWMIFLDACVRWFRTIPVACVARVPTSSLSEWFAGMMDSLSPSTGDELTNLIAINEYYVWVRVCYIPCMCVMIMMQVISCGRRDALNMFTVRLYSVRFHPLSMHRTYHSHCE